MFLFPPTEELFALRSNDLVSILAAVESIINKYDRQFAPLLQLCPGLPTILTNMLIMRFGIRIREVNWTSEMTAWTETDLKHVGKSMAFIIRMVQTGDAAVAGGEETTLNSTAFSRLTASTPS